MAKHGFLWDKIADGWDMPGEVVPGQSVLELLGENQVLIEGHKGVRQYGPETIDVKLRFGLVCVRGCGLELTHMTRSQLVIRGRIDSIELQRR